MLASYVLPNGKVMLHEMPDDVRQFEVPEAPTSLVLVTDDQTNEPIRIKRHIYKIGHAGPHLVYFYRVGQMMKG